MIEEIRGQLKNEKSKKQKMKQDAQQSEGQ